ncbi:sugar transporter [Mucilaginibacter hurinus]|uniref:Sugar transporter n=1 Tax=Mucilaginibacter hurinus TaxID=2201324 RepID=A0A367GN64_9SPHI|nr:protein-disulfide reductase DsbD domain-containing protein [Mucilaginibacter hurinus]RCH54917.1 sugar transporter [Mucilaginibacter hurinus]
MKKFLMLTVAVLLTTTVFAQIEKPVKWSYAAKKINSKEAVVLIKATVQKGWHIYSQFGKDDGPIPTTFTFTPSKDYTLAGKASEPKGITKYEAVFKTNVTYFENTVIFQQKIKLNKAAAMVKGSIEYMVCNEFKCIKDDTEFSIPVN